MSDGPGHLRLADHGPALAGQIAAGLGAALALLGPFSDVIAGIGVAILIIGVVLAAPAGRQPGPVMAEWWSVLALAALATLIGYGLQKTKGASSALDNQIPRSKTARASDRHVHDVLS